jgi:hypothetical protein
MSAGAATTTVMVRRDIRSPQEEEISSIHGSVPVDSGRVSLSPV